MTPTQLREMATHYRQRPSVDQEKQVPRTAEVSDRECEAIAEALEHAAHEIEAAQAIARAWRNVVATNIKE